MPVYIRTAIVGAGTLSVQMGLKHCFVYGFVGPVSLCLGFN